MLLFHAAQQESLQHFPMKSTAIPFAPIAIIGKVRESSPEITSKLSSVCCNTAPAWSREPLASLIPTIFLILAKENTQKLKSIMEKLNIKIVRD